MTQSAFDGSAYSVKKCHAYSSRIFQIRFSYSYYTNLVILCAFCRIRTYDLLGVNEAL